MKNETTMILANKLALYFSSSELNNFESKLEKDIDEIEQMKLDFCDIYRKYISFEIENEETHCPIFAQTSVSFKNVKELDLKIIHKTIDSNSDNTRTSPSKNGHDHFRVGIKSNQKELLTDRTKTPVKFEKKVTRNEKLEKTSSVEKKEIYSERTWTPVILKKVALTYRCNKENKVERKEKKSQKRDNTKDDKDKVKMQNRTDIKEKIKKEEYKTEEKNNRHKKDESIIEPKDKIKLDEIKTEEKKEKIIEKPKKEEANKEDKSKLKEKQKKERYKQRSLDMTNEQSSYYCMTEESKKDDSKENSKKISYYKIEKSIKKKEDKIKRDEDKKEDKKKEEKNKKEDKKPPHGYTHRKDLPKDIKSKESKESKNKLNSSILKENQQMEKIIEKNEEKENFEKEEMEKIVEKNEEKENYKSVEMENKNEKENIEDKNNEIKNKSEENNLNMVLNEKVIEGLNFNENLTSNLKFENIEINVGELKINNENIDKNDIVSNFETDKSQLLPTENIDLNQESPIEKEVIVDEQESEDINYNFQKNNSDEDNQETLRINENENEISKTEFIETKETNNATIEIIKLNKLKLNYLAETNLGSNANKALLLMLLKNYLPKEKIRIKLITCNRYFSNLRNIFLKDLLQVNEKLLKEYKEIIEKNIDDPQIETQVIKLFQPSKTAINSLNFVTKDEESNLAKKDQPIEVINIFKIIYMIIDEEYYDLEQNKIISNFLTMIIPRLKQENLKSFFNNYIGKTIIISPYQIEKINKFVAENPRILISSDLLKINRCISYMTFMVKEILDYNSIKTSEGQLVVAIRYAKSKLNEINDKVTIIKSLL